MMNQQLRVFPACIQLSDSCMLDELKLLRFCGDFAPTGGASMRAVSLGADGSWNANDYGLQNFYLVEFNSKCNGIL